MVVEIRRRIWSNRRPEERRRLTSSPARFVLRTLPPLGFRALRLQINVTTGLYRLIPVSFAMHDGRVLDGHNRSPAVVLNGCTNSQVFALGWISRSSCNHVYENV